MKLILQRISESFSKIGRMLYSSKSEIVWTLPFLAFCIGYFCLQFFIIEHIVQTPNLVGKDLLLATKISSENKLNLRIIAEKEVADATPGTIIKQNPLPGTSIKSYQSIFIVITKLPEPIMAPTFIAKSYEQIDKICKEKGIKNRVYFLPTNHPSGQCFAQMPAPNQPLEAKKMSSYIAINNQNQYLFPDFTDIALQDVTNFLNQQNISFEVYHKDQKIIAPHKQNFIVSYQKPLAGTLITPSNKLYVQLQVV